jgi:hypothetical protein
MSGALAAWLAFAGTFVTATGGVVAAIVMRRGRRTLNGLRDMLAPADHSSIMQRMDALHRQLDDVKMCLRQMHDRIRRLEDA